MDTSNTKDVAAQLAERFDVANQAARRQQYVDSVHRHTGLAREIVNGVDEPEAKITEIATVVIFEYEEYTLSAESRGLKLNARIEHAMESAAIGYSNGSPIQKWQMDFGLRRGQDALFGADRVVRNKGTLDNEIQKHNGIIVRRIERHKQLIAQKMKAAKAKKKAKDSSSAPTERQQPATKAPRKELVTA